MDPDIETALIISLVLIVPAVIIFIVLTVIRVRRSKIHRRRIIKKSE